MNSELKKHVEILNREMGEVRTEIIWIKKEITELKIYIQRVSNRTWYILTAVIIGILIQIALAIK